jgi:hypothetical protein
MPTFALGLPHTPWVPERVESWRRLLSAVGIESSADLSTDLITTQCVARAFTEREPNRVWARRMWSWGAESGASHLVTLQDDVTVSPRFWACLRAMIRARPDDVIGLSSVHPMGPEIARQGRRWYQTAGSLVGWAYVVPVPALRAFLRWCDERPETVLARNEDDLLGDWCSEQTSGATWGVWHPVPTLADHDVSIASTYANDSHMHRRATVTWRGYPLEDLAEPDWWRGGGPLLPPPTREVCWACQRGTPVVRLGNVLLCGLCVCTAVGAKMGVQLVPQQGLAERR